MPGLVTNIPDQIDNPDGITVGEDRWAAANWTDATNFYMRCESPREIGVLIPEIDALLSSLAHRSGDDIVLGSDIDSDTSSDMCVTHLSGMSL